MSCKNQNDEVYMDLMNQRTEHDKRMLSQYDCIVYEKTYPDSLISMLPPGVRVGFPAKQTVDLAVSYQLNPTMQSIKAAQGNSNTTNKGVYPPTCGYDNFNKTQMCHQATPYPYANLDIAYNPTAGSTCVNLGQDLNFQYGGKR